jgi:hypothetical protein
MLCFFLICVSAFIIWINSSTDFAAVLIVEFIFDRLLSCLLVISTNWSYLYFVLRHSAILVISALWVGSICDKLLPTLVPNKYSIFMPALGYAFHALFLSV